MRRADAAWGAAGLAVLAGLYLAFPDRLYVFDGVMFAGIIERSVDDWRVELFNRRHLLFNPLMMGARDLLLRLGPALSGYDVMQRVNAVAAALGVGIFFSVVRKTAKDSFVAFAAALLFAVSAAYWARAAEGQVYLLMSLGALASLWTFLRLLEAPGPATAAAAAFSVCLAALFHIVDAVLLVPAAVAFYFAGRKAAGWGALFFLGAGLGILLPYAAAFHLRGLSDVLDFFVRGTGYFSTSGNATFAGLIWRFFHTDALSPAARAALALDEAGSSLLFGVGRPWVVGLGGALAAVALLAARASFKDKAARPAAAVLTAFGLAFILENAFWLGGVFFWAPPLAALLALAAIPAARRLKALAPDKRRAVSGLFGAGVAVLGAWNFWTGILPQSRLENNKGYRAAQFVAKHTAPNSWIVISGIGAFPNSKVYLPYFAHRSRQVLEYFFDRNPKAEALRQFREFLGRSLSGGVPVYLLSDLVEDAETNRQLLSRWNLSIDELRGCFGPGSVLPVARSPEGLGIYLYEPKGGLPALFSGLGYAALTQDDEALLSEFFEQLKIIADNMTPAGKREAAALLKKSDYGAGLLLDNFQKYMDEESQAAARRRLDLFHEYQKTRAFHLRLGGFYHLLGMTEDQKREWEEAARLSNDPEKARRALKLR